MCLRPHITDLQICNKVPAVAPVYRLYKLIESKKFDTRTFHQDYYEILQAIEGVVQRHHSNKLGLLQDVLGDVLRPFLYYLTATFENFFIGGFDIFDWKRLSVVKQSVVCVEMLGNQDWLLSKYHYLIPDTQLTATQKEAAMEMEAMRFVRLCVPSTFSLSFVNSTLPPHSSSCSPLFFSFTLF